MIVRAVVIRGDHDQDYTITADVRGVTCSCPDFAFRGAERPCKHIVFVKQTMTASADA